MNELVEREIPAPAAMDIRECAALKTQAEDRLRRTTDAVAKGMGYDLEAERAEGFVIDLVDKDGKLFFRRVSAKAKMLPPVELPAAPPNRKARRHPKHGREPT